MEPQLDVVLPTTTPTKQQGSVRHEGKNRRHFILAAAVVTVVLVLSVSLGVRFSKNTNKASSTDSVASNNTVTGSTNIPSLNNTSSNTLGPCDDLKHEIRAAARLAGLSVIENALLYFDDGSDTTNDDSVPDSNETVSVKPTSDARLDHGSKQRDLIAQTTRVGVDEADLVRSNGTNIFLVYGNELVVLDAATLLVTSRTLIPQVDPYSGGTNVLGLLLVDNRLVVFNQEYETSFTRVSSGTNTTVFIYDTATMRLVTQASLPGAFTSAHAVGPNVHVVTGTTFEFGELVGALQPSMIQLLSNATLDADSYRTKANEQLERLLESSVEMVTRDLLCVTPFLSEIFNLTWSSLTTITSFDASSLNPVASSTSLLLPSSFAHVYASSECLVLLCRDDGRFSYGATNEAEAQIYLFPFTLVGAAVVSSSPGTVPGYAEFPSSVHHLQSNGKTYIHILTTIGWPVDEYDIVLGAQTLQLSVLEMTEATDTVMPLVGQLTGLANPGDVVYAILFQGERAFVATANDTDSFYALNVSDPTNPRVAGSRTRVIPGHTLWLHSVGPNVVLGVGGRGSPYNSETSSYQLTVWNVSSSDQLQLVQQWPAAVAPSLDYNLSFVTSQMDYRYGTVHDTVRYVRDQQLVIVPTTETSYQREPCTDERSNDASLNATTCFQDTMLGTTFEGFRLFKINSTSGISPYLSIAHSSDATKGCSGGGFLSPRFLITSNVMVILNDHSVSSYDVFTGTAVARVSIANCSTLDEKNK